MASARLHRITKRFPNGTVTLRDFELSIEDGEFMVLVGPSGCGKSTALRILAGLEAPSGGQVFIGDRDVTSSAPRERDVAMVFQSYALYPHKTVRDNLSFGLRMRGVERGEIERRTREIADKLALQELLDRRPAQLSGGQRQRVALGRALVRSPRLFLLDEPLSNLDAKLRMQMRAELARLHLAFGVTTLYVTHDQEEAMTLGQRITVLSEGGRIQQVGTPSQIYDEPASAFVAEFIGTPGINWFRGEFYAQSGGHVLRCDDFELAAPEALARVVPTLQSPAVSIGIRPHDLTLSEPQPGTIRARVELVELLGSAALVHARSASNPDIRVLVGPDVRVRSGDEVALKPAAHRIHVFDVESGARVGSDMKAR